MAITLALVAMPLGVAALLSLATDCGRNVDLQFFELWAQILPVLALPSFLERGGIMTRRIEAEGLTAKMRAFTAGHVTLVGGSLLVGESVALYAVATRTSTTFLVAACILSGLFQLAWLSLTTALRIRQEGRDRHASKLAGGAC